MLCVLPFSLLSQAWAVGGTVGCSWPLDSPSSATTVHPRLQVLQCIQADIPVAPNTRTWHDAKFKI